MQTVLRESMESGALGVSFDRNPRHVDIYGKLLPANVSSDEEMPVDTLFLYWKSWCERENRNYPGTKETFCRDIHAAVPHVSKVRKREGEARPYYYRGIGLKSGGEDVDDDK